MTDKLTPGHQEDAKKIIEFVGSVKPIEVMTDKDKKLAEEMLVKRGFFVMTHKEGSEHVRKVFIDPVIEAMQEYAELWHSAKIREEKIVESFDRENDYVTDRLQTPIEDGLYATGRFTQDECSILAEGIMMYINEYLKNERD